MMKTFLKSAISFIAPIIIIVAVSHMIRTVKPVPVFEFEIDTGFSQTAVGPGGYMECYPVITNIGNIDGFVSFKVTQPLVPDEEVPLYIIDINDPWEQKEEVVLGDSISTTYLYSVPLKPGETTVPLCNGVTMADISLPSYARMKDINIALSMYAESAE